MTQEFFKEQISRLKNAYNDKAYPDERVKIFWEHCKHWDGNTFMTAVSNAIANEKYAPLLTDLQTYFMAVDRGGGFNGNLQRWIAEQGDCNFCGKFGNFIAIEHGSQHIYAFKCHMCKIGNRTNPYFPEWQHGFEKQYEPKFIPTFKESDILRVQQ